MCISPSFVHVQRGPGYEQVPVPCKDCWQCRHNRINDYVGRGLAELYSSDWCLMVNLTYAPRDDLAEKIITPRHFQNFIRALRDRHHKIRYLACGEYGSLNGRAHFHALLFGKGQKPKVSLNGYVSDNEWPVQQNIHTDEWPHGHMYVENASSEASIRYVCKYILKGEKDQYWFTLSKKPPLGAAWFALKAKQAVELGALPSTFDYLPPGGDDRRSYLMTGATRRYYLEQIVDNLCIEDARLMSRASEWVGKSIEKLRKYQHEKRAVDLSLSDLIDNMREQQEVADRVFNADWEKNFWTKHKNSIYCPAKWRAKK